MHCLGICIVKFLQLTNLSLQAARAKALAHQLPMELLQAEFQFDRTKLTLHYKSDIYIDFSVFMSELYVIYKVPVWMKLAVHDPLYVPRKFATLSLSTGQSFTQYCT